MVGINSLANGFGISNKINKSNNLLSRSLEKLSSGKKINSAKDNPAGLVISNFLQSQNSGILQAIRNNQEAYNVIGIAEGGLNEVSSMLNSIKGLATHAGNSGVTGRSQVAADQAEVNSMLGTINRIASTTKYSDQFLLNGNKSISAESNDPGAILDMSMSEIKLSADVENTDVDISFSGNQADQAEKAYLETDFATGNQMLTTDQEFTVTGELGSQSFSFTAGTQISEVAEVINQFSGKTGVEAYATDTDSELRLTSTEYGSSQSVSVEQSKGDAFAAQGDTATDTGQDLTININGQSYTGEGLTVDVQNSDFSGTFQFNQGADTTPTDPAVPTVAQLDYAEDNLTNADVAQDAKLNTTGGMRLQLGEGSGGQEREDYSLPNVSLSNIGQIEVDGEKYSLNDLFSGGRASLANDPDLAMKIVDQAVRDVSAMRADMGAYQANTLQATQNSLEVAFENITAAESGIADTDFAKEVTEQVAAELKVRTGVLALQQFKNSSSNILKLLG